MEIPVRKTVCKALKVLRQLHAVIDGSAVKAKFRRQLSHPVICRNPETFIYITIIIICLCIRKLISVIYLKFIFHDNNQTFLSVPHTFNQSPTYQVSLITPVQSLENSPASYLFVKPLISCLTFSHSPAAVAIF